MNPGVLFFADVILSVSTPGKLKNWLTTVGTELAIFAFLRKVSTHKDVSYSIINNL